MRIDSHVHVGAWRYFDDLGRVITGFAEIIAALAGKGFSGAALMPSDSKTNQELLDEIRLFRKDGRGFTIWFFPWLNPEREGDLDFVRANLAEIDGLKFHPTLDRLPFRESAHGPFLDIAAARKLPVLVHCGAWQEMAGYRYVLDVAAGRPEVNFILAHQGGSTYELKTNAALDVKQRGLANVFFDLAGTHEYWLVEYAAATVGADRLLLGSDFPIRDAALYPALIEGCRLQDSQKEQICAGNFLRLTGSRS